jgi:hypothetical protein
LLATMKPPRVGGTRAMCTSSCRWRSYSSRVGRLSTKSSHDYWSLASPHATHSSTSFSPRPKLSPSLLHYREHSRSQFQSRDMTSLKAQALPDDPIERTFSPYPNPLELGPKSKILATRTSNYHSTSLRMVTATNPSVNRTCKSPFTTSPS